MYHFELNGPYREIYMKGDRDYWITARQNPRGETVHLKYLPDKLHYATLVKKTRNTIYDNCPHF